MLTKERLQYLFQIEECGTITRLVANSNASFPGETVGTRRPDGYLEGSVDGRLYLAHHIVWIYFNGQVPEGMEIDHRNRNKSDNSISNLRLVTKSQNAWNASLRSDSTSGWKGVTFNKKGQMWYAQIQAHGKRRHIGQFTDPLDAASAYNLAAYQLHGEFARYNEPEGEAVVFA